MVEVLTFGEPMGLLAADEVKPLKEVECFRRYVCGAEVNFSVGLARLGHAVAYVSKIGHDPFGEHIRDFLQRNRIDNRYVKYDEVFMTGMQLKEKVQNGADPLVVNYRGNTAFSHFSPGDLADIDWQGVRHLHVTGIPAALSATCRKALAVLMDMAKEKKICVSFDPNLRPALWPDQDDMIHTINALAAKADIVLPGVREGERLTGSENPEEIADFYLQQGVKAVVVKVGAAGSFVKTRSGESFTSPAFHVNHVVDTVGAGDGFAVGTISALLEGEDLRGAVRRGAAVGALAVMSPGDNEGLPTREELERFMQEN